MTDVLGLLAARTLGVSGGVRPAVRPLFAGEGGFAGPAEEEETERDATRPEAHATTREVPERAVAEPSRHRPADQAPPVSEKASPSEPEVVTTVTTAAPPAGRAEPAPSKAVATPGPAPAVSRAPARVQVPERTAVPRAASGAPGTPEVAAADTTPEATDEPPAQAPAPRLVATPRAPVPQPAATVVDEADGDRVVHVTIGRIDVRAVPAPAPPRERPREPWRPGTTVEDYLGAKR